MKNILIVLFLISANFTYSQLILGSKNYTDKKRVKESIITNEKIIAATEGGIFTFSVSDSVYETFTKTDGLSEASLTSISLDKDNKIWVGSGNGIINVYFPSTGTFKKILDIYNTGRTLRQINHLLSRGDTLFVSTDFGFSLININDLSFYDTFFKFSSFPSYIRINSSYVDNLIYLASESGVVIQKEGATNLVAPESWDVYTTVEGLPVNNIFKIGKYNGKVIASSSKGLSQFNNGFWTSLNSIFNNKNIQDFFVTGDSLFVLANNILYIYKDGEIKSEISSLTKPLKITGLYNNNIVLSTLSGICIIDASLTQKYCYPNSPQSNQFTSIAVDSKGSLWSASGKDNIGVGFYRLSSEVWDNFSTPNYPIMQTNDYYSVYASNDGDVYLASWGWGFLRVKNDSVFSIFNNQNTPMKGIITDPNFLVIAGTYKDSRNNLWILNYDAADRKTLYALTPDSTWYLFENPMALTLSQYRGITIDQYDTKWFFSTDINKSGLFYYNENKTFNSLQDDKYGYLSTSNGLNSNSISAVVTDKRGDLWIGTNLGVNVISNVNAVLGSGQNPQFKITSLYSLRQQTINCIAVDPVNQKWVGTNQGLFIVSPDGTTLLAAYDSKNSPILNDQIKSISIDEKMGYVYVAGDGGIAMFMTTSRKPLDSFTDLTISPSPFLLDNSNKLLKVDGLIKDATLMILDITGKLIKTISTLGGAENYWDGRDESGALVNSGVYIIVATDQKGDNIKTGKIAVIRK